MGNEVFDDPRLTAMGLFIEVFEGVTARTGPVAAAHGLSGNDFDVLIRLARSPDRQLRMSDLADQTSLTTSGMTRVVDRLEREGLVCREACPTDRRASLAVLTDQGTERLGELAPAIVDTIERWFTGLLTADQLEAFLGALRTMRMTVRPDAAAGSGH